MYTTIKAYCYDQTLQVISVPEIASGGENVNRLEVTFNEYWSGYGKTAVFYRKKQQVYHVVMTNDACEIPREVTAEPGVLYIGIIGVNGSSTRTSTVVVLTVEQGAPTGLDPFIPLPDVYKQVLSAYAEAEAAVGVERARIDNLASSGTVDGELIDIRVGADGEVHDCAGDSVRTQFSALRSGVETGLKIGDDAIDLRQTKFAKINPNNIFDAKNATVIDGYYDGTGTLVSEPLFRTVFFRVVPNTTYYTNFRPTQSLNLSFFDASGNLIHHLTTGSYTSGEIPACDKPNVVQAALAIYSSTDIDGIVISETPIDDSQNNTYYYELPSFRATSENLQNIAPTSGKSMLIFGDSITATATVSDDGSTYTEGTRVNWPKYAKTYLNIGSMWNFAKSGAHYKDDSGLEYMQWISNQINTAISSGKTADIIVLSAGTNDANGNYGSFEEAMTHTTIDSLDRSNLYEAVRWSMWKLRTAYPEAVCFVTTPIHRADREVNDTIRNAILSMASRYNFIVIDAERESGIVRENEIWGSEGVYLSDGLHPNEMGSMRLAILYSSVIKRYFV